MKVFSVVDGWLDNVAYSHSKSTSTRDSYRRGLREFCSFIESDPDTILKEYEASTDRVFRRRYAQLLRAWIAHLSNNGYSKNTVTARVMAIKSFFKYNDLPLAHVATAKSTVTFHNRDITKKEIVLVIGSVNTRERAFYSVMAQSGLRPDTLCKLRLKHIEPELNKGIVPCKIEVPAELAKGEYGAYFTFISEDAIDRLKAYLATRPGLGPEDYVFASRGSDEPLNRKSASNIFSNTIETLRKKGLLKFNQKQAGKPKELRMYNLRKWFRNQAAQAGVEYVNFWMGHKANYKAPQIPESDAHYFSREQVEVHRRLYMEKAAPYLRLDAQTPGEMELTIKELRSKVKELEASHARLQPLLDNLPRTIRALKELKKLKKKEREQAES